MDELNTDVLPPKPSAETPAGGVPSETPELELELESEGLAEGEQPEGEGDEFEDWEHDGKAYKVPKPLKPHLMRDKDYTQSKQQLAEQRKAAEAERKAFADEQKFFRDNMKAAAGITAMNDKLAAFEAITDEQWSKIDPAKANEMHMKYTRLKGARDRALGELQSKEREALDKQRETDAKRREDGFAAITKAIPSWSDDHASKLNGYAVEQGYTLEELEQMPLTPHAVVALDKAYRYDQLVAKQRAKAKQSSAAEPTPVPVPKVATRRSAPSSEPLDSDPPDVWLRKRNAQLKANAR
jgi:hypothetical protein